MREVWIGTRVRRRKARKGGEVEERVVVLVGCEGDKRVSIRDKGGEDERRKSGRRRTETAITSSADSTRMPQWPSL